MDWLTAFILTGAMGLVGVPLVVGPIAATFGLLLRNASDDAQFVFIAFVGQLLSLAGTFVVAKFILDLGWAPSIVASVIVAATTYPRRDNPY